MCHCLLEVSEVIILDRYWSRSQSYSFQSRSYSSPLIFGDYLAWTCLLLLHSCYRQQNRTGHLTCTLFYQANFLLRKILRPSFYKAGLLQGLISLPLYFSDCSDCHCSLVDRLVHFWRFVFKIHFENWWKLKLLSLEIIEAYVSGIDWTPWSWFQFLKFWTDSKLLKWMRFFEVEMINALE